MSVNAGAARPHHHCSASALSAGHLLYLASVGLVAIAVIGVFFGTGLLLLVPPAGGTISRGLGAEVRSPTYGLLSPTRGVEGPPERELRSSGATSPLPPRPVMEENSPQGEDGASPKPTAFVAPSEPERQGGINDIPQQAQVEAPPVEAAQHASAPPAAAPDPASRALAVPTPSSPYLRLSAAEISELLTQGDARLQTGDIASARLFYERGAAAGDGRAALRLGATFDPAFLGRAGLRNVRGDVAEARSWYSRALELGAAEAQRRLTDLETKKGR